MKINMKLFMCKDDGEIPNNRELPVIVYEGIFQENPDNIELTFNRHQWTNSWVNGIFDYHHYHTNTHEVLGVKAGQATVLIGGEKGEQLELHTGDVIVLPAGTGHKRLKSSADFSVVGAYPEGKSPNLKKRSSGKEASLLDEINRIGVPETDPVFGEGGPLLEKWKKG